MAEEAVPEVLLRDRIVGPVGDLGVDEDDADVRIAGGVVAPDVVVAVGRVGVLAGLLEPAVLIGGVVHHEVGDDPQAAGMRRVEEGLDVLDRAVVPVDRGEVGDVVPVVLQRRGVHRQQPDAVDAEVADVVEPLDHAAEVTDAVGVAVLHGLDGRLVEDGVLEPKGVGVVHARAPQG